MKARGKEIYIIAGVIAAVVCAAWYFLFFSPVQKKIGDLNSQITLNQQALASAQSDLVRLKAYAKTAPQTRADLVRLNKLIPSDTGVPSAIIELTSTAKQSGVDFRSITPGAVTQGTTFSVQPIELEVYGRYFDFEDFLYRLEDYVAYRNGDFLVTGRMFQVSDVKIGEQTAYPNLDITVTVNSYLWNGSPSSATAAPVAAGSGTASTSTAASTVGVQ